MLYVLYDRGSGQIKQICNSPNVEALSHLINDKINLVESRNEIDPDKFYINVQTQSLEKIPAAPTEQHIWDIKRHCWQSVQEIEQEKENKWNAIKLARNKSANSVSLENNTENLAQRIKILRNSIMQARTLSDIENIKVSS